MAGNHKSGGKLTRSHTTIIDIAVPVITWIEKDSLVNKISLGIIKKVTVGTPRIKFLPITGGFKMVIRGRISIQEFFIYTKEPDSTQKAILKKYSEVFQ
jgi:hypothetical protein